MCALTTADRPDAITRRRLRVTGVVQGVGFRPFVYTLARENHLSGFVGNDSSGVFIEVEGPARAVDQFMLRLRSDAPPLAYIERIDAEALPVRGELDFAIVASAANPDAATLISPDLCVCDACLRELRDPADHRYRYPFINCTHCGPRFTIIRDIPYDRPLTTMADFVMCPACAAEYHDPANRRFHAQPNACPDCGPQVTFHRPDAADLQAESALSATLAALDAGQIVAIKGLGGFHLACDATRPEAVAQLRARKGRREKPFAVMVADLQMARRLAHINAQEATLLTSRERPIVLLRQHAETPIAEAVAPGNPYVGVMLAYTPLHVLLTDRPLVMTSANYTEEPIVKDNAAALDRLATLADAFLLHDRKIHVHCDDSVVRVLQGVELPVRRSRGYAPFPVKLPHTVRPLLAVGGELKATFCLTRDDHAFMSQHIGDMANLETLHAFQHAADHMLTLFRVQPQAVICDQHPGYLSTRYATDLGRERGLPVIAVQHHHAHIAAVMAENGCDVSAPVIGFSFDGTGYGDDGAIWGGEVFIADYRQARRVAHLAYAPLPGGDAGVMRPYRLALAHLWAAGIPWADDLPPVRACEPQELSILRRQLERSLNTVPTSSMGRLFDAVAALIGLRQIISYEAQAAIELEAVADLEVSEGYDFGLRPDGDRLLIETGPVLAALIDDWRAGIPAARLSARFHAGVADVILRLSQHLRLQHGLETVALSGGVFQNVHLLTLTLDRLRVAGFRVLTHRQVPPNDGGLALGQAMIGHALLDAART